jgi:hypothetical protein
LRHIIGHKDFHLICEQLSSQKMNKQTQMAERAASAPLPLSPAGGSAGQAPVSGLASLPPFIAQSILQSAVPVYEQNKLTVDNVRFSKCFRDLASVSKLWHTLAFDAASNVALCTLVISVSTNTRGALAELRRQLTLQRTFLVALDIQHIPTHGMIRADQWAALLSCVPRLQEVKLDSLNNAPHAQLGAIVQAVGEQCKNLQSLVVSAPHRNNQDTLVPHESMRRLLSEPVHYAMEQVYKSTHHEGLHRLCVCMRFDLQGLESTRKYIDHVLHYCPNLERFDGYRAAVYALDGRMCYEQWFMDIDLWTRFCSTLHRLVEFDWICVPFATRFFEIFGQHTKPKMKGMTITTAMNWKWQRFLQDIDPQLQEQLVETGFAGTAKNAHAALRACPNLKELRVCWYSQPISQPSPPLAEMTTMDPEIFGDEFWEAAVRFCPLLTSVSMLPVCPTDVNPTVRTFTDRSLRAIAGLPSLGFFESECVNVTGDGIFHLTVHHAPSLEKNRRFHFSLGDAQSDSTDERFYDALLSFLQILLTADAPLPCMERSVSMSLENKRRNPVQNDASKTYLATLRSLIPQIKEKHAGVQLNVFANDCDGTSFSQISNFVFDTRKELTRLWMERDDTVVADSIWNRVAYHWDDDDDDDYYDDEDLSDGLWEGHSDIDYDDYYQEEDFWGDGDDDDGMDLDGSW